MAPLQLPLPSPTALTCILVALATSLHVTSSAFNCEDYSDLDEIEKYKLQSGRAEVVVSGTVTKLHDDARHSTADHRMFTGDLEIKRIFMGRNVVDNMAVMVQGMLRMHQKVTVEGFGDSSICDNMVREHDTKIFMLVPNGNGNLRLNSSILPVTLNNLNSVDHVVNGEYMVAY